MSKKIIYAKLLPAPDLLADTVKFDTGWAEQVTVIGDKQVLRNCQFPVCVWTNEGLKTVACKLPDRQVARGFLYEADMPSWFEPVTSTHHEQT